MNTLNKSRTESGRDFFNTGFVRKPKEGNNGIKNKLRAFAKSLFHADGFIMNALVVLVHIIIILVLPLPILGLSYWVLGESTQISH